MTERQYQQEMEKIKRENRQKQYRQNIKAEKDKLKKKHKMETSKFLAFYLFALLNAIVIYAMVSMWKFADLSYLGVLITDIAAQILIYGIYCLKAYKAKKSEEDLKFKREQKTFDEFLNAGAECKDSVPATTGSVTLFGTDDEHSFDNIIV